MKLALPRRRSLRAASVPVAAAGVLALLAGAFLLAPSLSGREAARAPLLQPAQASLFFDEHAFARAVARTEAAPPQPMPGVRALIIPHHWLAGHLILSGLRDLSASGRYDRIVLIGPDHTNSGAAAVTTSDLPWQTAFGPVRADTAAVGALTEGGLARNEPGVLDYEHSVAGIVPAVAYYLPGAEIIPLALRHALTAAEIQDLAAALAALMDGRTALVAAVDFSHYLPAPLARERNTETVAALRSLDAGAVLSYGDEHVDSPASIATLMAVMRLAGATAFELRASTNSAEVAGDAAGPVTSYITGYYH